MIFDNFRHILQSLICSRNDDFCQVLGRLDGRLVQDSESLIWCIDEAAGSGYGRIQERQRGRPQRVTRGANHLIQ